MRTAAAKHGLSSAHYSPEEEEESEHSANGDACDGTSRQCLRRVGAARAVERREALIAIREGAKCPALGVDGTWATMKIRPSESVNIRIRAQLLDHRTAVFHTVSMGGCLILDSPLASFVADATQLA